MAWIGLDIGGANLKLATSDGINSRHLPFPLWQDQHGLAERLVTLIGSLPAKNLAVTMTGEL